MKLWMVVMVLMLSSQLSVQVAEVLRVYNWDAYIDPVVI